MILMCTLRWIRLLAHDCRSVVNEAINPPNGHSLISTQKRLHPLETFAIGRPCRRITFKQYMAYLHLDIYSESRDKAICSLNWTTVYLYAVAYETFLGAMKLTNLQAIAASRPDWGAVPPTGPTQPAVRATMDQIRLWR